MGVSKTSELTERQLSAPTENKMVGGKAGNKIANCALVRRLKYVGGWLYSAYGDTLGWRKGKWMILRNEIF